MFLCATVCVYLVVSEIISLGHESGAYATVNDLEQAFGSDITTEIVAYAWLSIAVINYGRPM